MSLATISSIGKKDNNNKKIYMNKIEAQVNNRSINFNIIASEPITSYLELVGYILSYGNEYAANNYRIVSSGGYSRYIVSTTLIWGIPFTLTATSAQRISIEIVENDLSNMTINNTTFQITSGAYMHFEYYEV